MKVLWSVNVVLPDVAKKIGAKRGHSISWVDAMRSSLENKTNEVELAIVCYGGIRRSKFEKYEFNNVTYYILPYKNDYKEYWNMIVDDFSPDIIHIYGTEKKHNLDLIKDYKNKIPMIISLQGIISEYVKHYYAHIPLKDIIFNYTLRDIIFRNGIFAKKNAFKRQSNVEIEMLQMIDSVEGRSDWDRAISENINPNLRYYYCPRMIRKPFWDYHWKQEETEKLSIFVHQGDYPIKGLHLMLEALSILKRKFPNVKLYVSGDDIFSSKRKWERGYTRYIRRKIETLKLEDSIEFTGYLNADKLAKKLSEVNVCVIPSAIENAPNALAEAMIIGTPCVASYVGGNAEMLNYGELGLLYCYSEPQLLADRVSTIFNNEILAYEFSEKSREYARKKHNPETLETTLLNIYNDEILSFNKKKEDMQ